LYRNGAVIETFAPMMPMNFVAQVGDELVSPYDVYITADDGQPDPMFADQTGMEASVADEVADEPVTSEATVATGEEVAQQFLEPSGEYFTFEDGEGLTFEGYNYRDDNGEIIGEGIIVGRVVANEQDASLLDVVSISGEGHGQAIAEPIRASGSIEYPNNTGFSLFLKSGAIFTHIPPGEALTFSPVLGDEIIAISTVSAVEQPPVATAQQQPSPATAPATTAIAESGQAAPAEVISVSQNRTVDLASRTSGLEQSPSGAQYQQQLAETAASYRAALLNEIPAISDRYLAATNSNILQMDAFEAWNELSTLLIVNSPKVDSHSEAMPQQQIITAVQTVFQLLYRDMIGAPGVGMVLPSGVAGAEDQLSYLATEQNWAAFYVRYYQLAIGVDQWLLEHPDYRSQDGESEQKIAQDREASARLEKISGDANEFGQISESYGRELSDFAQETRGQSPTPITAYFTPQPEEGAEAIPPIPLTMYYWLEDGKWNLSQILPRGTYNNTIRQSSPEETAPPVELFEQLNSKKRFSVGTLDYSIPGDRQSSVEI
ncbi:MAG: hypothetical protein AAGJ69_11320, partial [Cyanobacteria bacterium J06559_1]